MADIEHARTAPGPTIASTPSRRDAAPADAGGTTTIADSVVAVIAGIAIRETDGVHSVGKGASRALGAVTGRMSASSSLSRAVKVEVGETQTAIDVDIEVEYGVPIHELASQLRTHVSDAVETMTGLDVVEININVFAVHVPGDDSADDESADSGSRTR
ncbi:Asp23/Gls24 family envelope stress response protein [Streptomyces sp. NPDC059262]|uniref:Asp23/Gls24 family envelope stress response protein n=1 Tax=Streptomyces sp. NPDC059262 TaxID=3346797 RepID=UPI00369082C7